MSLQLLVALTFNGKISEGFVQNDVVAGNVLETCGEDGALNTVCSGCDQSCAFGKCAKFDVDCIGSKVTEEESITRFADHGACICQDTEGCPTYAQNCECPQGLYRICEMCEMVSTSGPPQPVPLGIDSATGKLCSLQQPGCSEFPAFNCPAQYCAQWGCSCFNPTVPAGGSYAGVYNQAFTVDKNAGKAECSTNSDGAECPVGFSLSTDETECCTAVAPKGHVCNAWDGETCTDLVSKTTGGGPPGRRNAGGGSTHECKISSCCIQDSARRRSLDMGGTASERGKPVAGDGDGVPQDLVQCTVTHSAGEVEMRCMLDAERQGGGTPEGIALDGAFAETQASNYRLLSGAKAVRYQGTSSTVLDESQLRAVSQMLANFSTVHFSGRVAAKKGAQLTKADAQPRPPAMRGGAQSARTERRSGPSAGPTSYDGGFVLLKLEVAFKNCDTNCERAQLMHMILETTFTATGATAFNPSLSAYTVEIDEQSVSLLQTDNPGPSQYMAYFKITGGEKDSNDLFDLVTLDGTLDASFRSTVQSQQCCASETTPTPPGQGGRRTQTGDVTCAAPGGSPPSCTEGENFVGLMEVGEGLSAIDLVRFVCGDGEVQHTNPIDGLSSGEEECDLGYANTHAYSACSDGTDTNGNFDSSLVCQCNEKMGYSYDDTSQACQCGQRVGESNPRPTIFTASETSAKSDASNDITFDIEFADHVQAGKGPGPGSQGGPMVVEIVGLTGTQTSGPTIDVTCEPQMGGTCTDKLGRPSPKPHSDPHPGWDWGKGDWDQTLGILKFNVVASVNRLKFKIRLQNRAVAQDAVRPYLRICGSEDWPAEPDAQPEAYAGFSAGGYTGSPLLGSNERVLAAGSCQSGCSPTLSKADEAGIPVSVAKVTFASGATTKQITLSTPEAIVGRGVTQKMYARLDKPGDSVQCNQASDADPTPTCSTFAGKLGSMLQVDIAGKQGLAGDGATLELEVDERVVRRRGGCFVKEDKTLKLCVPGVVGLYKFNEVTNAWESKEKPSSLNVDEMKVSMTGVISFSTFAALATPQCCDYEGVGASCGDKVCQNSATSLNATILMGGGTLSKMPGVQLTNRRAFTTVAEVDRAAQPATGAEPKTLDLKQTSPDPVTWYQLCPGGAMSCSDAEPDPNWPAPRFGHSVVTVGYSTVLIYGGIGCSKYEALKVNGKNATRCTALKTLDDLWEINMMKALTGDPALISRLLIKPSMPGLAGMTKAVLPGADNRVLIFGGSSVFHAGNLIMQRTPAAVDGLFQFRDIEFRAGKGSLTDLKSRELSSNTMVQNGTQAILFGGFIGNSLSSAVFKYDLTAASPELAFSPLPILSQQAPPARGFPGLVKPDDDTLVVFGGYAEENGQADMWKLDIVSSSWSNLFKENSADPTLPSPTAFGAFSYFDSGGLVLCTHGGLQGGYKAGTSFRPGPGQIAENQVSKNARYTFWSASGQPFVWDSVLPKGPVACCNPSGAQQKICSKAGYAPPCSLCCEPEARAMHTLLYGIFTSGVASLTSFGGVNQLGQAMPDLMQISMDAMDMAPSFELRLTNVGSLQGVTEADVLADFKSIFVKAFARGLATAEGFGSWVSKTTEKHVFENGNVSLSDMQECEDTFAVHIYGEEYNPQPPAAFRFRARQYYSRVAYPASPGPGTETVNLFGYPSSAWAKVMTYSKCGQDCWTPPPGPDAWIHARNEMQSDAQLKTSVFNASTLDINWCASTACMPDPAHCPPVCGDVAFEQFTYDDLASCDRDHGHCMRGICMGSAAETWGQVSKDNNDEVEYCYRDGTTSPYAMTECGVSADDGTVTPGFECSLPGPRHGHRALTFTVLGKLLVYAVFGGEATDLMPGSSEEVSILSNDVHVLRFVGRLSTWVRLWTTCDDGAVGGEPTCPEARRDPAVAVMGNSGGANGRLLVFGGMGGSNYRHGMYYYLERSSATANTKVFDDLWYLDLAELGSACVTEGSCSTQLVWHLVDVTGSRPRAGFGAGVILDPSDNLYITGGGDASFSERDDLFIFQLRDPYYKHCSATGSALTRAMAGVNSVFFLQCMDAFMEPADGATFTVDIKGPVGMIPGIVSLGAGKYSCSYTPTKIGSYTLTIYVGRGGEKYQDLVTGRDTEPSNNVLDGEFEKQCTYTDEGSLSCKAAQNPYQLTVVSGSTSPAVTDAVGSFLTLSTAGTPANFVIMAKDAFGNRRPGGDSITTLMDLWQCSGKVADEDECLVVGSVEDPQKLPETGTVKDNADGSYSTSYLITRAGLYKLAIRVAGTVGANSPFILRIFTEKADMSLTYVYGKLKGVAAGVASELYVQTRDQYGNAIRADEDLYPLAEVNGGTEGIQFQVCRSVASADGEVCGGGEEYTAVGVTIRYSVGPDGNTNDPQTSEPYWGLYQITYFPFDAEPVQPRVLHSSKEDEEEPPVTIACYFDTTGIEPVRSLMDPGDDLANSCITQVVYSYARVATLELK